MMKVAVGPDRNLHHLSDAGRGNRLSDEPERLRRRLRQAPLAALPVLAPRPAVPPDAALATGHAGAYVWPERLNPDGNHDLTHHVASRSRRARSPSRTPTSGP